MKKYFAFMLENVMGEHSTFVRFEKKRCQIAATLTRMDRFSCIMTWWIFMSDLKSAIIDSNYVLETNYYTFPAYVVSGQIHYLNLKPWTSSSSIPFNADMDIACHRTQEREPAHTWWCLAIPIYELPRYFKIIPWNNWFYYRFLLWYSLWRPTDPLL